MTRLGFIFSFLLTTVGSPAPASNAEEAKERRSALQGVFCNTPDQLDDVLANFEHGLSMERAVGVTNKKEIACSYIDLLHFVVRNPVKTGIHKGRNSTAKYEALLIGVIVGDALRPVSPPAKVFFVSTKPLSEVLLERRT